MRHILRVAFFGLSLVEATACGSAPLVPALPPVPTITSISPATFVASPAARTLTIVGTGFDGSYGAFTMSLTFPALTNVSGITNNTGTSFQVTGNFVIPGTYTITVAVRGQTSNAGTFTVTAPPPG